MDKRHWEHGPCPKHDCRKDSCKCGLKYVNIPVGLEGEFRPTKGAYCNAIVEYEANGNVYIYSKEGIPTLVTEECDCPDTPIPPTPEAVVHLVMGNASSATWDTVGSVKEGTWYRAAALSSDVLFTTDDDEQMTVEQLYGAVSQGEKFAIDIPFGEITSVAGGWTVPVSKSTAKSVEFSAQGVEHQSATGAGLTGYASSAVVLCDDYNLIPHSLPFGVLKTEGGDCIFFATIMGGELN